LTNFALGADYAQWLVGPVARIASPREIREFLSLVDDESAAAFVESFWAKRVDPENPWPDQQPEAVFERRAGEADKRFTEGVTLGRRTDRGEIHIVYGPPEEIDYESDPESRYGPIEVWRYGRKAARGLDGARPKNVYRFAKTGELTQFYSPAPSISRRDSRGVIK
jgi:GWxTD domain-containing protein